MLPLLAAAAQRVTPLEKLQNVSGQFWLKVILGIAILSIVIFIFKKVIGMNKIILTILLGVLLSVFVINWVYNRNEPECMTWLIDPIANSGFFPTKGTYENRQQQDPSKPGMHKSPSSTKSSPAPTPAPATPTQPAKK